MSVEPPTPASIRFAAMNLLSMREHSADELKKKLVQKYGAGVLVEEVVARLTEQDLQSDQRFTEAFVAMRQRQGKGSVLIKIELRVRLVATALIDEYVNESDPVWGRLAQQAHHKRFGSIGTLDAKARAKQIRFLQSRGFAAQHIQFVFRSSLHEDFE